MNKPARALLWLLLASAVPAQSKNLLFYGNSLTYYSWGYGVPELVGMIATEAGHPSPTIVAALVGGGGMQFHATNATQIARISNSLPPGQTWDSVVMQGVVLEATNGGGFSAAQFRSSAVTVMTNVRSHSPAARAVLFQTWAPSYGQLYYNFPSPWPNPMALHNEVRSNYRLATSDITAAFGVGSATNAAAGDAVALLQWQPMWYEPDLFHPNPAMILLAAMCIYTSVYGQTVGQLRPSFSPPGQIALALAPFGLGEAVWNQLAGIADTSADRAVRPYPGSGDHLLFESATTSDPMTAGHIKRMTAGTPLQMQIRSMNGVFDGAEGWLVASLFPTGSPPGPVLGYPELQVDPGAMVIVSTSTTLASPLSFTIQMPFTLPGASFLVQGVAFQASPETGNPQITTTDAHELVLF